jgi:hypothetical protein
VPTAWKSLLFALLNICKTLDQVRQQMAMCLQTEGSFADTRIVELFFIIELGFYGTGKISDVRKELRSVFWKSTDCKLCTRDSIYKSECQCHVFLSS